MLISFSKLCEKYSFIPSGIIHIGAHELEERQEYFSKGVNKIIWIEGNSNLVDKCISLINPDNEKILSAVIFSEDGKEFDFKITNNSQSSSILDFEKHKIHHPQVNFVSSMKVKTSRVDSLLKLNSIRKDEYDFVNLDIQGVELQALKGFGEYLEFIKYIYTEINTGEVYKGNDSLEEIDEYLFNLGFERVETFITQYEWGDAFYKKKLF